MKKQPTLLACIGIFLLFIVIVGLTVHYLGELLGFLLLVSVYFTFIYPYSEEKEEKDDEIL